MLRDVQGRVTGFVDGRIVNGIPGVRILTTLTSQNWRFAPEPTYLIPPQFLTPAVDPVAAPLLGQHTKDVLGKTLGYDHARIAALAQAGAFGALATTVEVG